MRAGSRAPEAPAGRTAGRRVRGPAVVTALVVAGFSLPVVFLASQTLIRVVDAVGIMASGATIGPLARSLLLAAAASATAGALGTALAWLTVRTDVAGRRFWSIAVPLPLVIPSFVGATALRFAFGSGGLIPMVPRLDGFLGAWLTLTLFTYPYVYLPAAARLREIPVSLEEAARLLGSEPRRIYRTVVWPQLAPAVYSGSLLVFLYSLSDFGAVSIMRYDTLTRAIFSARLAAPTTALTLGFVLAGVALVVAWLQQSAAPVKLVQSSTPSNARRARASVSWVAVVVPSITVGLALVAPVAAFLVWWIRGTLAGGGGLPLFVDTLAGLVGPAVNSALAGTVAAALAVAILLPVAFSVAAGHKSGRMATLITAATFALPGVVVAFAIVFWVVRAPDAIFALYQTFPLLIGAYVIHFGAQALQPMSVAVRSLPQSLVEAAGTLGAGPGRRFWTIQLPLLMPGLSAAGGLVLLSVLKELPATLLLAPIGFATLATKIWGAAEEGFLAQAGASSLVLILLSGVLTWALVIRRQSI